MKKKNPVPNPPDSNTQTILNQLYEHVLYLDTDMRIVWANQAACDSARVSLNQVIGRHCYKIWPDRKDACQCCPVENAMKSGIVEEGMVTGETGRTWFTKGSPIKNDDEQIIGGMGITLDTTEQVRAEYSLKETEEKYRTLFTNSTEGIITLDMKGRIQDVNSKVTDMTGFTPDFLIGKGPLDLASIFGVSKKKVLSKFNSFIKGKSKRSDWEITTNEGKKIDITLFPFMIKKGRKNLGITVMITDISEQKKAESALMESEAKYRNLIEQSNDAIYLLYDNKFEMINKRFTELFGYSLNETNSPDFDFRKLISPMSIPVIEDRIKRLGRGETLESMYEFTALTKSGLEIECEASVTYIEYKGEKATQGIIRDITQRKNAEVALRKSMHHQNLVMGSLPLVFYTTKASDDFANTWISEQVEEITGFPRSRFLNDGMFWTSRLHPDDRDVVAAEYASIVQQKSLRMEYRWKCADGKYRWFIDRATTLYDENDQPLEAIGVWIDITDRKVAEDMVKASLHEKEIMLKEIHHRVKNNLQIISSLLNLQSQQIKDEKALEAFLESRNRVHSMALVHDKLYRSEDLAKVDFKGYIESMAQSLFRTYNTIGNISLDVQIQNISLAIDTAIPCGLMMNELISNSLKHAFPDNRKGKITIKFQASKDHSYKLQFIDDGIGIPPHVDFNNLTTFGIRLIQVLVEQLDGDLKIRRKNGTQVTISFQDERNI